MAACAEGFDILRHANMGQGSVDVDAETTPLREPGLYRCEMNLPEIAEFWRRGSVIDSWLLDLTATVLPPTRRWRASKARSPTRVKGAGRYRRPWPKPFPCRF